MPGAIARRRRLGGGNFSPNRIAGLKLWLDATQISGTANGGALALWPDMSAAQNNAVQAAGAQQPIYNLAVQNGKPGVTFNGVNITGMFMTFNSLALTAFTIVEVYSWTGAGTNGYLLGGTGLGAFGGGTAAAGFGVFDGTNARTATIKPTAWGISTCQNSNLYRDGTETAYSSAQTVTGLTLTAVGERPGNTGLFFAGTMGEVLIYDSALSVGAMQPLWAYLKNKWGTP